MTTEEIQSLMLRLCLLEKECPENFPGNHPRSCVCHGTDKVSLLEGVREECPCLTITYDDGINHWYDQGGCKSCWIAGRGPGKHEPDCATCQGRGWVPTQDPWKWFKAIWSMRPALPLEQVQRLFMGIFMGEVVFFRAFEKMLVGKDA